MGDLPLRTPTDRRLGGPLPRQQANQTHPHPIPQNPFVIFKCLSMTAYGINPPFDGLSRGMGQVGYALLTRAPVVILEEQALPDVTPRLACVKPVASVHPEPGSNSPLYKYHIHFCHDSEIKVNFHFARCSKNCKISFDRLLYPFVVCFQDATENILFQELNGCSTQTIYTI